MNWEEVYSQDVPYEPKEGDRVLVEGPPGSTPGGITGCVVSFRQVLLDTGENVAIDDLDQVTLLYRPRPPRPVVESFTRSDGTPVYWTEGRANQKEAGWATPRAAISIEDAEAFARMYSQAAEQMRWDAEYGNKP